MKKLAPFVWGLIAVSSASLSFLFEEKSYFYIVAAVATTGFLMKIFKLKRLDEYDRELN